VLLQKIPKISPETFRANVAYDVPPNSLIESGKFDEVTHMLLYANWMRHDSCPEADETPGVREFLLRPFKKSSLRRHEGRTKSDRVIAWARAYGYRAPVLAETLAFAAAFPDLQRRFWIVPLGEFAYPNFRWIPVLCGDATKRALEARLFSSVWREEHRFLLVRGNASRTNGTD
jgi:hypothetical protein